MVHKGSYKNSLKFIAKSLVIMFIFVGRTREWENSTTTTTTVFRWRNLFLCPLNQQFSAFFILCSFVKRMLSNNGKTIPLLIPTWYTIFYINYIKLSSSTCFERHPLIFRGSMMLIVHVCSLWYSHSVKVKKNHFYRMRIPEAAYMYN